MWPETDFPLSRLCEVTQLESNRPGIQTGSFSRLSLRQSQTSHCHPRYPSPPHRHHPQHPLPGQGSRAPLPLARESTEVKVILLKQKRNIGWGTGEKFRVRACLTVNWWEAKRGESPLPVSFPGEEVTPRGQGHASSGAGGEMRRTTGQVKFWKK